MPRLATCEPNGQTFRILTLSSYIIGRVGLKESLAGYKDVPRFQRLIPDYKEHEDRS